MNVEGGGGEDDQQAQERKAPIWFDYRMNDCKAWSGRDRKASLVTPDECKTQKMDV